MRKISNWYKEAEKALEPGDAIQKSYPAILDGERGYLIVSDKRLIFQNVKGLFSKKYNVTLNVPLESIQMDAKGRNDIDITSADRRHTLNTDELPANIVMKGVTEVKEKATKAA